MAAQFSHLLCQAPPRSACAPSHPTFCLVRHRRGTQTHPRNRSPPPGVSPVLPAADRSSVSTLRSLPDRARKRAAVVFVGSSRALPAACRPRRGWISGSKSSQPPSTFSRTPASRSRSHPRTAAVRRSIPRATNPNSVLISRSGSRRTQLPNLSSIRQFGSTASNKKTSTLSSTRVAMVRCGISPETSIPLN